MRLWQTFFPNLLHYIKKIEGLGLDFLETSGGWEGVWGKGGGLLLKLWALVPAKDITGVRPTPLIYVTMLD